MLLKRYPALALVSLALPLFSVSALAQTPTITSVLNSADYSTRLCPGIVAEIFGTNFGSGPASTVVVTVGGKQAYTVAVTAGQVGVQIPMDAPTGVATTLTVAVNNVPSTPFNLTLDAYAPTLYTLSSTFQAGGTGTGPGYIVTGTGANLTTTAPAHIGDILSAVATGLGPTNPAIPTGPAPAGLNLTAATVTMTVGGAAATVSYAGAVAGQVGIYQINFKIPDGVQGTVPVVITVGGQSSNSKVTLNVSGISALVNNASFGSVGVAAPGSIVTVFANGLGTTNQTTGYPATVFQGVSVTFNGAAAPLFHLSATLGTIDLLVPFEMPTSGTVNVVVNTPSGSSLAYALTMAATDPGIYYLADPSNANRFNVIAQFNATVWLAMPASMAAALNYPACSTGQNPLTFCAKPAAPGDYLVLYTTGLGEATPNGDPNGTQLKTGSDPPIDGSVLYATVNKTTVTVGGVAATVLFSGIVPGTSGEYQIDFQVPNGPTGDDLPVIVAIGGNTDTRTVSVQQP